MSWGRNVSGAKCLGGEISGSELLGAKCNGGKTTGGRNVSGTKNWGRKTGGETPRAKHPDPGRMSFCRKIAPGMPWRKGTTSICSTLQTYLLLLRLQSIRSKLDRLGYEIPPPTHNSGCSANMSLDNSLWKAALAVIASNRNRPSWSWKFKRNWSERQHGGNQLDRLRPHEPIADLEKGLDGEVIQLLASYEEIRKHWGVSSLH